MMGSVFFSTENGGRVTIERRPYAENIELCPEEVRQYITFLAEEIRLQNELRLSQNATNEFLLELEAKSDEQR